MARSVKAGEAFIELTMKIGGRARQAAAQAAQMLKRIATVAAGAAAVLGGALVAGVAAATRTFVKFGDAMAKSARRAGVSSAAMSELAFAAEQSGASAADIDNAFKGLSRTLRTAELSPEGTQVKAIEAIGLTLEQLQAMDPESQFMAIAQGISEVQHPSERSAIAMELLGRSGRNLVPLMSGGAAGIAELRKEAQLLGVSLTEDQAAKAEALADAWNRVKKVFLGLAIEVGAKVAPVLTRLADDFVIATVEMRIVWAKFSKFILDTFDTLKMEWADMWAAMSRTAVKMSRSIADRLAAAGLLGQGFNQMFKFTTAGGLDTTGDEVRQDAARSINQRNVEHNRRMEALTQRLEELKQIVADRRAGLGHQPGSEGDETLLRQAAQRTFTRSGFAGRFTGFHNRRDDLALQKEQADQLAKIEKNTRRMGVYT